MGSVRLDAYCNIAYLHTRLTTTTVVTWRSKGEVEKTGRHGQDTGWSMDGTSDEGKKTAIFFAILGFWILVG
jgi:hypothetical protein